MEGTWKCYRLVADDGAMMFVKGTVVPNGIVAFYDEHENSHTVARIEECSETELDAAWDEIDRAVSARR